MVRLKRSVALTQRETLFLGDRIAAYVFVIVICAVTVLPLLYMVSLSLQSEAEIFAGYPVLWPAELQFSNYATLFDKAPFGRFILNSFVTAGVITIGHLILSPIVGYAFAKFEFPFKRTLFVVILSTLMVPFFVRMIPLYVMFANIGWLNTYQGLFTPFLVGAFGIFLLRQFIEPLPDDLIDAGRVDGVSEFGIFRRIILPQTKPALAVVGLFGFVFHWNEFIWPLIATTRTEMRTIPVGLTMFNQEFFTQWNLTAAGGVVMVIPTALLFLFTQRYFVRGIALTGMK